MIGHCFFRQAARMQVSFDVAVYRNGLAQKYLAELLAAAKSVERIVERKFRHGEDIPPPEREAATSAMWLAYEQVAIFCPEGLRRDAWKYADALAGAAKKTPQERPERLLAQPKDTLLKTARDELRLDLD